MSVMRRDALPRRQRPLAEPINVNMARQEQLLIHLRRALARSVQSQKSSFNCRRVSLET